MSSEPPFNNLEDLNAGQRIEIWKQIIDVQKHFNTIKSKNQTMFISILTASFIASGYLSQRPSIPLKIHFPELSINLYSVPILVAALFTVAFFILDWGVYHTLLKGAVSCGTKFEEKWLNSPELPSKEIEKYSENHGFGPFRGAGNKLIAFYTVIGVALIALFFILNFT